MQLPSHPNAQSDSDYFEDRARYTRAIIESSAPKKLIVAGPGTGKTHTFKELLKSLNSDNSLVLTFIRNLVEDLSRSLGDLARVNSFHGYCKNLLFSNSAEGLRPGLHYYPPLLEVMSSDMACVGKRRTKKTIERDFHDLNEDGEILPLAIEIGNYYNAVSHVDAVFRVFRELKSGRQSVEVFDQVVVDEYQDFSRLEVEFLGQLATANRVLIAGDDDQALYSFKQASAVYLRKLWEPESDFESFSLPYCTRCTEPVITATRTVIEKAQKLGLLDGRLDKPYQCFVPDKRGDNEKYPSLIHAHCSVQRKNLNYMGMYIRARIEEIPPEEIAESHKDNFPAVLVIGPNPFLTQIASYLQKHFSSVELKKRDELSVRLLDGYQNIMDDPASRLGWRIVMEIDPLTEQRDTIRAAIESDAELLNMLPTSYVELHRARIDLLTNLMDGGDVGDADKRDLEESLDLSMDELLVKLGVIEEEEIHQVEDFEAEPRIVLTTAVSSKGLQAQHVFMVGVNDDHVPKKGALTDDEVCKFLVSLTRTRKSCYLLSCNYFGKAKLKKSLFMKWLHPVLTYVYVNRDYIADLELPSGEAL